VVAIVW